MSAKTNLRSFRYSDEVAAILEQQEGKSLNDKFENLVLRCFYELPKWQKLVGNTKAEYQAERQKVCNYRDKLREFDDLFKCLESAQFYLNLVVRKAGQISEADVTQNDPAPNAELQQKCVTPKRDVIANALRLGGCNTK